MSFALGTYIVRSAATNGYSSTSLPLRSYSEATFALGAFETYKRRNETPCSFAIVEPFRRPCLQADLNAARIFPSTFRRPGVPAQKRTVKALSLPVSMTRGAEQVAGAGAGTPTIVRIADSSATIILHPEQAELRAFGNRRVQRCGESEPEHITRLRGVDDAVVPQPGRRVPRVALRLII